MENYKHRTKIYSVFSDGSYRLKKRASIGAIIISCNLAANDNHAINAISPPKIENALSASIQEEDETSSLSAEFYAAAAALDAVPENNNVILHCDPTKVVELINEDDMDRYAQECNPPHRKGALALAKALKRHKKVHAFHRRDKNNPLIRICHHLAKAADKGNKLHLQTPLTIPVQEHTHTVFSTVSKKKEKKQKDATSKAIKKQAKRAAKKLIKTSSLSCEKDILEIKALFSFLAHQLSEENAGYRVKIRCKNYKNDTKKIKVNVAAKNKAIKNSAEHSAIRKLLGTVTNENAISGLLEMQKNAKWYDSLLSNTP